VVSIAIASESRWKRGAQTAPLNLQLPSPLAVALELEVHHHQLEFLLRHRLPINARALPTPEHARQVLLLCHSPADVVNVVPTSPDWPYGAPRTSAAVTVNGVHHRTDDGHVSCRLGRIGGVLCQPQGSTQGLQRHLVLMWQEISLEARNVGLQAANRTQLASLSRRPCVRCRHGGRLPLCIIGATPRSLDGCNDAVAVMAVGTGSLCVVVYWSQAGPAASAVALKAWLQRIATMPFLQ
jgi:hypothetical protein